MAPWGCCGAGEAAAEAAEQEVSTFQPLRKRGCTGPSLPPFLSLHPCKCSAAATKSLQQFLPLGSVVCTWCVCCTRHRKAESRESRQASSEKDDFHELETELYWLLLRFVHSGALVAPTIKHSTVANRPNIKHLVQNLDGRSGSETREPTSPSPVLRFTDSRCFVIAARVGSDSPVASGYPRLRVLDSCCACALKLSPPSRVVSARNCQPWI